ncbi:phosphate ABC transporter permease PstA [Dethiothermospora halolimnae]|uniref:phosphate ABC transporter permease PstA n=1 Tax=Dethiothermospora halolimnae TaxID=3114390 RepID=UPI003CCBD0EE
MKKRVIIDNLLKGIIILSSVVTVGFLAWILLYVIMNGFSGIKLDFLQEIVPYIISTVYMILVTIVISTPIGIGAAIYLVEYAKPGKVVKAIRFATESLAGIPSIVFGLFGFIFFVTTLNFGWSILSGALTLSIMVLPTIVRTTEEALKSVPNSYREGSLGLGASKLRTIRKVILPSAIPGILTSVILSIGRIVGETAAIYLTAGTAKWIPDSVMDGGRTLAVHLYYLASEDVNFEKAFATGTVLIIIILAINLTANALGSRLNKRKA